MPPSFVCLLVNDLISLGMGLLLCRVLERYPTNGKLLRCYGRFLEDVRHDHAAAARVYGDAARHGGGDAIMSLDLSSVQQVGGGGRAAGGSHIAENG